MIETKERIQLPMMALRGLTVFPNMAISFPVGRQKSLDALEVADEGDKRIFLVAQRDPEDASPEQMGLYEFGTVATIKQILKLPGNMTHVIVEGVIRGRVLAIGGLQEKVLAAKKAGVKTVILPKQNEKDLQEISDEIKEGLEFILAKEMDDVLKHALAKGESVWK